MEKDASMQMTRLQLVREMKKIHIVAAFSREWATERLILLSICQRYSMNIAFETKCFINMYNTYNFYTYM